MLRRLPKATASFLTDKQDAIHMPRKSIPLTDLSQLEQALQTRKFVPVEDGLRAKRVKGKTTFEARYRHHGINRSAIIGTFPDDPIELVRQKKNEFFKTIEAQLKSGQIVKKEKVGLSKSRQRDVAKFSIKTEKHLWEFLREMYRRELLMNPEIESSILLMLLLPASPDEIFDLKWEDAHADWIAIDRGPERPNLLTRNFAPKTRRFAWLSQAAREALATLRKWTGETTYLFPRFQPMKREDRERLLNDYLKDYWKSYEVRISGLQHTFSNFAKDYSQFNPEFIDAVMKKKYSRTERHQDFYDFQIQCLLEWWGCNVWRLVREESYKSEYEYGGVDFTMHVTPNSTRLHAPAGGQINVKSVFEINAARAEKDSTERSVKSEQPGPFSDENASPSPTSEQPST